MIAFVRHGQTAANAQGRLQGRSDLPLSDLGREQAAAVAAAFADAKPVRVCSSPLTRARDTAALIAAPHGLTVEVDERLIEVDYGEWEGRSLGEVRAEDWGAWRADAQFSPPGGESLATVQERVASFVADALTDDLVIAVSHVSPIKAAVCVALGVDEAATWRMFLDLASVTRVGAQGGGTPFLLAFNDVGHLTPALRVRRAPGP